MTPSAVLLAAADLLERDGWCQGIGRNGAGKRCVTFAIDESTGSKVILYWVAIQLLRKTIRENTVDWNDAPGQTAENVIETLRRAAE
jgi:hypothetical protein